MLGDLNQDSIINVLDIIILVNIILGSEPDNSQLISGDLNSDGILNVIDIILLVNIILNR